MTETPRQRYLRNHAENIRLMKLSAAKCRAAGRDDDAAVIDRIAEAWEAIGRRAQADEDAAQKGGE